MILSKIKTLIKKTKESVLNNSPDFEKILRETIKEIDKAAAKGIIHKNNASRKKSRLFKFIKKYRVQIEVEKK